MSNVDTRCLDAFPEWLRTLPADALALSSVMTDMEQPESVRRHVAGALSYLFKSLDLIPDGIQDLGFLDDAFVFRVAARLAAEGARGAEIVTTLAADADLLREFLGADYARLERFVLALGASSVRGRSVQEVVVDESARAAFVSDLRGWSASYVVPSFGRDTKNLVKLRSFLTTKLPE